MKKISYKNLFFFISLNLIGCVFEPSSFDSNHPILHDLHTFLQKKEKKEKKITPRQLTAFENDILELTIKEKNNSPCGWIRIDYTYPLFTAQLAVRCTDAIDDQNRTDAIIKFLNQKLQFNAHHFFSFYMDTTDAADYAPSIMELIKKYQAPFCMVDMKKSFYHLYKEDVFLVPDYYLLTDNHAYTSKVLEDSASSISFQERLNIALWRGSQTGGTYNMENKESIARYRLVAFSQKNPTYLNARFTNHKTQVENSPSGLAYKDFMDTLFGINPRQYYIPITMQSYYKYIVSFDGNVSAWQRVLWILSQKSVLLYQTEHVQFFTPYLEPWIHYVPIESDMSDFKEKIDTLRINSQVAKKIATKGQAFAKTIHSTFLMQYYTKILVYIANQFE